MTDYSTTENVYQAPASEILTPSEGQSLPFQSVSISKFWILFISTIGLYSLVWFYQQWRALKYKENTDVWPVPRAIFQIFFTHGLMSKAAFYAEQAEPKNRFNDMLWATIFVVLAIVSNAYDRLTQNIDPDAMYFLIVYGSTFIQAWALAQAQKAMNIANADPDGELNNNYTAWNIIFIVIGVGFWSIILLGMWVTFVDPNFELPI